MKTTQVYYITKIKDCLSIRQKANPQYSLRAFARDIGVHHGTLGQVLKGTRPLPIKVANSVVNKLKLSPKEKTLFMESLMRKKLSIDSIKIDEHEERFMLDESFYKVLAEWEHVAILELFNLHGFEGSLEEITTRLNLSKNRAEVALNNLIICGLLIMDDEGKMNLAHPELRSTEDIKSQALRDSHIETMQMGIEKIESVEVELRDFSSMTVALSLDKLPEAKTIIREFRMKMGALLKDSEIKTDVFQLAIQFFPLTEVTKKNSLK